MIPSGAGRTATNGELLADRARAITDIEKPNELFDFAFDCKSLDEFEKHLP